MWAAGVESLHDAAADETSTSALGAKGVGAAADETSAAAKLETAESISCNRGCGCLS